MPSTPAQPQPLASSQTPPRPVGVVAAAGATVASPSPTAAQTVFTQPPAGSPPTPRPPVATPVMTTPQPQPPKPGSAVAQPTPTKPIGAGISPMPAGASVSQPSAQVTAPKATASQTPLQSSQGAMPLPTLPPVAKPVPPGSMSPPSTVPTKSSAMPAPTHPGSLPSSTTPPPAATIGAIPPKFSSSAAAAPVKPAPVKAEIKKPPFWLFAGIGVVLLLLVGYWLFSSFGGAGSTSTPATGTNSATGGGTTGTAGSKAQTSTAKPTPLVYWGLWEPSEVMLDTFKAFEKQYPQYTIDYRKQSYKDYRERLQTAIASGNGPDLFRFHATWTPMLKDELTSLPASVMSSDQFQKTFYPIAREQLELNGKLLGLPVMYDGLALYYNKAILQSANASPPKTWAELKSLADTLTVPANKSERDRAPLQRAGMAIGNATNVEHFSDILGLLILQNGGDPAAPNSDEVRDALLFYTNFVKEDKVWSDAMPNSTVAFARGDVAMMLAPPWRALDIKAMNPDLDFGVAPVPKLGDKRIGWASYWAEGVNSKSKNQTGAWTFINFLASAEGQKQFFSSASQVRSFGEPYSRQDLAGELASDPILGNILADAPTAKSWYLTSFTHDNGLDDQIIKYYGDAVTATLTGKPIEEILTTLGTGVTQVLRQYGVGETK